MVSQQALVCHGRGDQGGNCLAKTSGGTVEVEDFPLVLAHRIQCLSQRSEKVSQRALVCHGGNKGGNCLANTSGGIVEVEAFQLVIGHLIQC